MSGLMGHELFHKRLISFLAPCCLILLLLASQTNAAPAHYLKASVTNNLKDSSKCLGPGWTDKLQWAIKSGECNSGGAFTPVSCVNDQTKTINPGETIQAAKCELNELPAGNYEIYCIRVIWCQKEPRVRGLFKLNTDGIRPVENKPPVADAKAGVWPAVTFEAVQIYLDEGLRFFGSGSIDPDGTIKSYSWKFGDGSTDTPASGDTQHKYASPGTYDAVLTVTDDKGLTGVDRVNVIVIETPVAVALGGTSSGDVNYPEVSIKSGETVYLDGSKSTAGGTITSYAWFSNIPGKQPLTATGVSAQFTYPCAAEEVCTYRAYLTIVDEKTGWDSKDAVSVKVSRDPKVKPPTAVLKVGKDPADIKYERISIKVRETAYFDFSESNDPNGRIITYNLTNEKTGESLETPYDDVLPIPFSAPGTFPVVLLVKDDEGATAKSGKVYVVVGELQDNNKPTVVLKYGVDMNKYSIIPASKTIDAVYGKLIYFDGSGSSDPDGPIQNYEWFLDGQKMNPLMGAILDNKPDKVSWRADIPGTHTLELIVTDGQGGQAKETVTITVKEDPSKKGKGITLLFVPVDWSGPMEPFNSLVDLNVGLVRSQLHLDECSEELVHALKVGEKCNAQVSENWKGDNDASWMLRLYECVEKSGITGYDYIIAAKETYGGDPATTMEDTDVILVAAEAIKGDSIVLAHELGHIFGLQDEYYDSCRCFDPGPNCLDPALGGSDPVYPSTEGYCAGGSNCPLIQTTTCKGNQNEYGGRCIMSYANALRPREFCSHCREQLRKIPELRCEGMKGGDPSANLPPVADAKAGFYENELSKEVSLNLGEGLRFFSTGSNDPDGSIISYDWDYGDGEKEKTIAKDVHHSYKAAGEYTATLTVRDNALATASDSVKVTVRGINIAVALVGTTPDDIKYKEVTIKSGEKAYLDASGSTIIESDKVVYSWIGNGKQVYELKAEMSFNCVSEPVCEYRVVFAMISLVALKPVSTDLIIVKVTRDPSIVSPTAEARVGVREGIKPLKDTTWMKKATINFFNSALFDCSNSKAGSGTLVECEWTFPGGEKVSTNFGGYIFHLFRDIGTYDITLRVKDDKNIFSEPDHVTVEVVSSGATSPEVVITASSKRAPILIPESGIIEVKYGEIIVFDGSKSTTKDSSGIYSFNWFIDGAATYQLDPQINYQIFRQLGLHTVELVVTDQSGGVGREKLRIIVKEDKEKAGLTILFVPVNLENSMDDFHSQAERQFNFIIENLPVKDCPGIIKKIELGNCPSPHIPPKGGDDDLYLYEVMSDLHKCVDNNGRPYDYIIGIIGDYNPKDSSASFLRNTDVIVMPLDDSSGSSLSGIHELGQALGLQDEYYDYCKCKSKAPNCLDPGLGGGDGVQPAYNKFCAGGDSCVGDDTLTCKGNQNTYGGRCIMSYYEADKPRAFCTHCLNYLSTLQALKCPT
jgi:PKD repeat protein